MADMVLQLVSFLGEGEYQDDKAMHTHSHSSSSVDMVEYNYVV
jgi:hypothetical protein